MNDLEAIISKLENATWYFRPFVPFVIKID